MFSYTHSSVLVHVRYVQLPTWTNTYLDKHILVLHHKGIGVNVARERLALIGLGAVLQLAGDVQRLCTHGEKKPQPLNQ
jgi:hypothetical protein